MKKLLSIVLTLLLILSLVPVGTITVGAYTSGYYTYTVLLDGGVSITDVKTSISGDVTVPSILGGYPVTSIAPNAFKGCSHLKSITIPDSVTSIGNCAFTGCSHLTSITIPDSVTSIGSEAFDYCTSLTSIIVDSNNQYYSSLDGILFNKNKTELIKCLVGNTKISHTIPDSVTSIDSYAFYNCTSLINIIIPDSVTSIGDCAFANCTSLTSITIPDSVTSIGEHAFSYCTSLANITLSKNIKKINSFAFVYCTSLTNITIPDSVTSIERYAFSSCTSLTNIIIPDSVTSIGSGAFSDCTSLTDIWYFGGEDEKNIIDIYTNNESLLNATWHYINCNEHEYLEQFNLGYTCIKCKYSKAPNAPLLDNATSDTVTLVSGDGLEYSKDGKVWQTSNVFTNLSPNTTYTFYQRVRASDIALESEKSEGLTFTTKLSQTLIPSAPIISSYTDTTVTLITNKNYEYSKDGRAWQVDNVFTGLSPVTKYTFYQRYAENEIYAPSIKSSGTSIITDKSKQTLIPDAPTVKSFTENSITLNSVDGCEYSKDGINWQTSNVFRGLSCGTVYNFYQRYEETTTTYAGKSSERLVAKTDKGFQTAPSKPTVSNKTHNSVTLSAICGYEYSRDGINWQLSNVFEGLTPETNYIFYQRKVESDRYYASLSSAHLTVKTSEAPECVLNPILHQYTNDCDPKCNICGSQRIVQHDYKWVTDKKAACGKAGIKHEECTLCEAKRNENTVIAATGKHSYNNACDTKCNVCSKTRTITHSYKTTTKKATTSKNGSVVKACSVCGKQASKTTIYYAKKVKPSTTEYTYNGKAKKPSVKVYDSKGNKISSSDYTVSYKDNKKVGKATVTIKLKGKYSGTLTAYFTIVPKESKVEKLTAAKKSLKVKLKKVSSESSGYEIQYSTSSKFSSKYTKTKKVTSYKTTSVTLKSLKAKKIYYVRVRTYKIVGGKKYYSDWSSKKYKKSK